MNKIRFIFDKDVWINEDAFIDLVCEVHNTDRQSVLGESRKGNHVTARAAAIYILRTHTTLTAVAIGKMFNRDHASILHHFNSVSSKIGLGFGKEYKINQIKAELILSDDLDANSIIDILIRNSRIWGEGKGLTDVKSQSMKLMEEVGELMASILKDKREEQLDSIGDIMVVLSILSNQLGIDITEAFQKAYDEIKNRTGKTVDGSFIKQQDL